MTWVSHIVVGASTGKLLGFKYALTAFGSCLPDLIEHFIPAAKHRGLSHSLTIWLILSVIASLSGILAVNSILFGVMVGHLLMDMLTVTGVPLFDDKGRYITLFGGKLRTGTAGEYAVSILIGVVAFILSLNGLSFDTPSTPKTLYEKGFIDYKEYRETRFRMF